MVDEGNTGTVVSGGKRQAGVRVGGGTGKSYGR